MTPYVLVDAERTGTQVPREYVEEGKIVFNVGPQAVDNLELANDAVAFNARFGGTPRNVAVPTESVLAIYARENGKGMVFTDDDGEDETPPPSGGDDDKSKKPSLRVVK
jgi:stringent starvation protein B